MTTLQLIRNYGEGRLRMGRWEIPPEPGIDPIYECQSCGFRFTEPGTGREYRGEHFGFYAYEYVTCCPHCGGGYIEV